MLTASLQISLFQIDCSYEYKYPYKINTNTESNSSFAFTYSNIDPGCELQEYVINVITFKLI